MASKEIERIKEYLRLRVDIYIENMIPEKRLRDYEEIRLYDSLMEIISAIDYAGIKLSTTTTGKLKTIKEKHKNEITRLIKEGKYKIL